MHGCMSVCIVVCIRMHVCRAGICSHMCATWLYAYTHVYIYEHVCLCVSLACMHVFVHKPICKHVYFCTCAFVYLCVHACMRTCENVFVNT